MLVPPGMFVMGMADGEGRNEDISVYTIAETRPRPTVTFALGFWMARDAVTVGEYRRFRRAKPARDQNLGMWSFEAGEPDENEWRTWENPGFEQGDDHPVVGVSWIMSPVVV